ncbi:MAG: hypothetical protein INQ03_18140 [Candidatus Heimdallarchaeota archaeon]|nr:hypothetical protein [Candidatus Heimdallarchaeota archaeon]
MLSKLGIKFTFKRLAILFAPLMITLIISLTYASARGIETGCMTPSCEGIDIGDEAK